MVERELYTKADAPKPGRPRKLTRLGVTLPPTYRRTRRTRLEEIRIQLLNQIADVGRQEAS